MTTLAAAIQDVRLGVVEALLDDWSGPAENAT